MGAKLCALIAKLEIAAWEKTIIIMHDMHFLQQKRYGIARDNYIDRYRTEKSCLLYDQDGSLQLCVNAILDIELYVKVACHQKVMFTSKELFIGRHYHKRVISNELYHVVSQCQLVLYSSNCVPRGSQ